MSEHSGEVPTGEVVHVQVDPTRCAGSGDCILRLPSHFTWDDDGLSRWAGAAIEPGLLGVLKDLARDCPTQAIGIATAR